PIAPWTIGSRRSGPERFPFAAAARIRRSGCVPLGALLALLPALRFLVEAGARILVLPAGPPVHAALLPRRMRGAAGRVLRFRRIPQPPLGEPFQLDVLVGPFELTQGRQQFLPIACAERGRRAVDQYRPVGKARRHVAALSPSRSASTSRPASSASSGGPSRPVLCCRRCVPAIARSARARCWRRSRRGRRRLPGARSPTRKQPPAPAGCRPADRGGRFPVGRRSAPPPAR